jgi:hypothetical protein
MAVTITRIHAKLQLFAKGSVHFTEVLHITQSSMQFLHHSYKSSVITHDQTKTKAESY